MAKFSTFDAIALRFGQQLATLSGCEITWGWRGHESSLRGDLCDFLSLTQALPPKEGPHGSVELGPSIR
jgi:hypothetical protein